MFVPFDQGSQNQRQTKAPIWLGMHDALLHESSVILHNNGSLEHFYGKIKFHFIITIVIILKTVQFTYRFRFWFGSKFETECMYSKILKM